MDVRVFWKMVALFWRYWPRAILTYFCLFAGAGLSLLIPRLTGQAIDAALGNGNREIMLWLALGIAVAGLLRSILDYFQTYFSEYLSQRVAYDLRNLFYDSLQRLSYAFHDRSQTGQLMSRATADIEAIRSFVGFAMLRGVFFIVQMVAIAVILFKINWQLAAISLFAIPIISYRAVAINQKLRKLWARTQQALGTLETIVQENLAGVRVVRAFAREDFENLKFRQRTEEIYNLEIEINNLYALNSPVMSFTITLAMAAILWFGGRQVIAGTLTNGELAQFLLYLVMFSMPIRMLGWLITLFSRATAAGRRVFEVIDSTSPVTERPGARELLDVKGSIKFENVCFAYAPEGTVLQDISFEIRPGQVIALVGASGSGKSTIANLIPRFYDVSRGRITIDGVDIRDVTLSSLRRNIGIVHQDTFLFSATIKDNISYGRPDATMEEIISVAKTARLHDFIISLPDGYDTWVGERGITLSGGQKQRLAIARTLLVNPRILIMDDSTSSVDMETEYLIQQALAELPAGRTTIIIAHRLRSVQMADLILVLKDGRIVEQGKHEELMLLNGVYRRLYDIQFRDQQFAGPELSTISATLKNSPGVKSQFPLKGVSPGNDMSGDLLPDTDDIIFGKPYDSRVVTRMLKYFTPYKVALTLTIIATLLFTATTVISPYLIKEAQDEYISTAKISGLSMIVLLFLANALLNGLAYYTQIRAEARLGQAVLRHLRNQLFNHLQRLPLRFFDRHEIGRILSRVHSDVGELGEFLDSGAFWVIGEVVSLILIVITMFLMDYKLALLALSPVPLLFVFLLLWQKRARFYFIKVRQAISAVNQALQENITGIRVIQSLSREDLNFRHFDNLNRTHFQANLLSARTSAMMMPVVETLVAMAITFIVFFGGSRVLEGTLMTGVLLAFVLYVQSFFDPIRSLTMEYTQLQRAMASGARVFELLDVKPEINVVSCGVKLERISGDIRFEHVDFSYLAGQQVLHDINFHVCPGQTVALVGPTGAGKSTIISLIARFYEVSKGTIYIDDHDLQELDRVSYRRQLGLVLQEPFLFSATVKENIRYGNLQAGDEDILRVTKLIGAHDFIIRLENGYDTLLEERGQNLSMGQRQLISFARAILADPAILLLDEATANIDSYTEQVLQHALGELLKGRTSIIIAHRLSTIKNADNIIVMDEGKIVEQGTHTELLATGGLYSRLYEISFARVPEK